MGRRDSITRHRLELLILYIKNVNFENIRRSLFYLETHKNGLFRKFFKDLGNRGKYTEMYPAKKRYWEYTEEELIEYIDVEAIKRLL